MSKVALKKAPKRRSKEEIEEAQRIRQEKLAADEAAGVLRQKTYIQKMTEENGPEEWRVCTIEPSIQFSSWGRVKRKGKMSHLAIDKEGYQKIKVNNNSYRLHRLILEAFIPNPDPEKYTHVDHINNIHSDNRVSNLRWCTAQENSAWAGEMGLQSREQNSPKTVCVVNPEGKGFLFRTLVAVADYFEDLSLPMLNKYLSGKRNNLKGYKIVRMDSLEDLRINGNL